MTAGGAEAIVIGGLGEAPRGASGANRALPVLPLDPRTYRRARDCVHCGLCLPACPTYTTNALEADSPRGRIHLMKGLADGRIDLTAGVRQHLDLCLDCRACETACPSGVVYHELIEETRAHLAQRRPASLRARLLEALVLAVFPHPRRLKLALLGPRLLQKLGLWGVAQRFPLGHGSLAKLRDMLPASGPVWERALPAVHPARAPDGRRRATVVYLTGCISSVLEQEVNRRAVALLQLAGCEVRAPATQACCGAIHHHAGRTDAARALARRNLAAMLGAAAESAAEVDEPAPVFIVSAVAGCGAMLREYATLLRDDAAWQERATRFCGRVRDVTEVLAELGLPAPRFATDATVAYHEACHLVHGQGVSKAPRELLASIPGVRVVPLAESTFCCGAAGTYNLAQPAMSRALGERKIRALQASGATLCAAGNIGCGLQIRSEALRLGVQLKVAHPVELLYAAHFGPA